MYTNLKIFSNNFLKIGDLKCVFVLVHLMINNINLEEPLIMKLLV